MASLVTSAADAPGEGERSPQRPVVLVVDDSADMRTLIAEVLTPAGYEVVGVPSGARALRFMADRIPDVMITDLFMPGMSGFTLRSTMLRRPDLAHIPVIVLSAYWHRPGETLDAVEAIPKPINIDRLLEAVGRLTRAGD